MPGPDHPEGSIADLDRGRGLRVAGPAVVDHKRERLPRLAGHVGRRDRRILEGRLGQHHRAGQHPHALRQHPMSGNPQPQPAATDDRSPHRVRQAVHEAFPMVVTDEHGDRAGPAAAGQPAAERAHSRRPIERLLGAFQGERQPWLSVASGRQGLEPLHQHGMSGAGGDDIVGFRGESDRVSLRERLHRTMHDVAGVFGETQIDDRRRHGMGGRPERAGNGRRCRAIRLRKTEPAKLQAFAVASQGSAFGQDDFPNALEIKVFSGPMAEPRTAGRRACTGVFGLWRDVTLRYFSAASRRSSLQRQH